MVGRSDGACVLANGKAIEIGGLEFVLNNLGVQKIFLDTAETLYILITRIAKKLSTIWWVAFFRSMSLNLSSKGSVAGSMTSFG